MTLSVVSCKNNGIDTPITPLTAGETNASVTPFGSFHATDSQVTDGLTTFTVRASIPTADAVKDSVVITIIATKQGLTPYTIDFSSDASSLVDYCIVTASGTCTNYRLQKGKGNGTLRISNITVNSNVQGTFSGTLQALNGTGTITISGGEFYASF